MWRTRSRCPCSTNSDDAALPRVELKFTDSARPHIRGISAAAKPCQTLSGPEIRKRLFSSTGSNAAGRRDVPSSVAPLSSSRILRPLAK